MKFLMKKQEQQIIKWCMGQESIGQGASRICYQASGREINEILEEDICNKNTNYVIKIAIGLAGVNQIDAEVNCFLQYESIRTENEYSLFAEIVAVGDYVEIMLSVDVSLGENIRDYALEDYDTFAEALEDCFDEVFNPQNTVIELEKAYNLVEKLNDYIGTTSDNGQIGYDWNTNQWFAYDYGYEPDSDRRLTSDASDSLHYNEDLLNNYLQDLIDKALSGDVNIEEVEINYYDYD